MAVAAGLTCIPVSLECVSLYTNRVIFVVPVACEES